MDKAVLRLGSSAQVGKKVWPDVPLQTTGTLNRSEKRLKRRCQSFPELTVICIRRVSLLMGHLPSLFVYQEAANKHHWPLLSRIFAGRR